MCLSSGLCTAAMKRHITNGETSSGGDENMGDYMLDVLASRALLHGSVRCTTPAEGEGRTERVPVSGVPTVTEQNRTLRAALGTA